MSLRPYRKINGETVSTDETTGGIVQQRVGAAGLIEIDGRKEVPGRLAAGSSEQSAVALSNVFKGQPTNSSNGGGLSNSSDFPWT